MNTRLSAFYQKHEAIEAAIDAMPDDQAQMDAIVRYQATYYQDYAEMHSLEVEEQAAERARLIAYRQPYSW